MNSVPASHVQRYTPAQSMDFWAQYEPQILEFLQELESREEWVTSGVGEAEPKLVELITCLGQSGPMPLEGTVGLMRILSALPYRQSIHALWWMDENSAPAARDVIRYTYENRTTCASANIMWQRLERVARFRVLSGLVTDLVGEVSPTADAAISPATTVTNPRGQTAPCLPALRGSRRLCAIHNEEMLPFLTEDRTIDSLNDVDPLFGNRRFYLLTEDIDLCRSLAPYGVGVDQYGGYVTRGPACDFGRLNHLLPLVARRSIKPLFGDLIPQSSWASNLARLLTRSSWARIRRPVIEAAGHRCEICGAKESEIDCHEQWEYHEPIFEGKCGVQRLVGFWAMCAECHATQHLGRTNGAEALERLRRIGRMSEREAQAYRAFVFDRWKRRSRVGWMLDLSSLAGSEPLVVHSGWTRDGLGSLTQNRQVAEGKTVPAQTWLLGVAWRFSSEGSAVYSARAVDDGYYE